jgi:UDP-2,4-diacetamido-2,4,6-trideoxy-beta-L-altropyranose hydrolase
MRILIRADGHHRIGIGHVMRMLALAQHALAERDEVTLASSQLDAVLVDRARGVGVKTIAGDVEPGSAADVAWLIQQAGVVGAEWVIVDGYQFDADYQERLREAGSRVLFVDDNGHCERYTANLVLNQNVSATPRLYRRRRDDTRLLLGPAHAMLRQEFASAAARPPAIAERADRILVTLGGADPARATERVVSALQQLEGPELHVKVIMGPSNPVGAQLAAQMADSRIEPLQAADDMAPLMTWADLAVTGAGVTVYELAALGVPTFVLAIAESQRSLARALEHERLSIDLGWHETLEAGALAQTIAKLRRDVGRRTAMSRRMRDLVDGRGVERVRRAMMLDCPG